MKPRLFLFRSSSLGIYARDTHRDAHQKERRFLALSLAVMYERVHAAEQSPYSHELSARHHHPSLSYLNVALRAALAHCKICAK